MIESSAFGDRVSNLLCFDLQCAGASYNLYKQAALSSVLFWPTVLPAQATQAAQVALGAWSFFAVLASAAHSEEHAPPVRSRDSFLVV